jgi:hypothetical protein
MTDGGTAEPPRENEGENLGERFRREIRRQPETGNRESPENAGEQPKLSLQAETVRRVFNGAVVQQNGEVRNGV